MTSFSRRCCWSCLLPATILAAGCAPWIDSATRTRRLRFLARATDDSLPPNASPHPHEEAAVALQAELAQDAWLPSPPGNARDQQSSGKPKFRWRHQGVERLLSESGDVEMDLRTFLADDNPVVRANAAMALARTDDLSAAEPLVAAIENRRLSVRLRAAAIEALGAMDHRRTERQLEQLLDQFRKSGDSARPGYVPQLHAELLRARAGLEPPASLEPYIEALGVPSSDVRIAALQSWATWRHGDLPNSAENLAGDADAGVRAAAIRAVASCRPSRAEAIVERGLYDDDLAVLESAISALGIIGNEAAGERLKQLVQTGPELIRLAAIAALGRMGAQSEVLKAADDRSWRVRIQVSAEIARFPGRPAADAAGRLVRDPSGMVQRQTVAAMTQWPLPLSIPILLAAIEQSSPRTRRAAVLQLSSRWAAASELDSLSQAQLRDRLPELGRQFREQFPRPAISDLTAEAAAPPAEHHVSAEESHVIRAALAVFRERGSTRAEQRLAAARLVSIGEPLVWGLESIVFEEKTLLPEAVYDTVLPQVDPRFALLVTLAGDDLGDRRRAASALAEPLREPPRRLLIGRLATVVSVESDPVIWRGVLAAIASDGGEVSVRIAYAAVSHPNADIRRRGCQHLADHPSSRHKRQLLTALGDRDRGVVKAAAVALGRSGPLEDPAALERLLGDSDRLLRAEAAASLARLDYDSGANALERLAWDSDPDVRRRAAELMGELRVAQHVPVLIRLLDDRPGIRLTALSSLSQVTGLSPPKGATGTPLSTSEQVAWWKAWSAASDRAAGDAATLRLPRQASRMPFGHNRKVVSAGADR